MASKKLCIFMTLVVLLLGLCACDSDFDKARDERESNKILRQAMAIQTSDLEVSNVEIDYINSSSYSSYLDVVGIVKNKSAKEASSVTLTLYLYSGDRVILTEKDYVFDLGPYDENSFKFMVDQVKLLTCDRYVVKVTDVF